MRRISAMILVLSLVLVARRVAGEGGGRFATMAIGFILVTAALVGEAFEHVRLPKLTGYLLVGLAVGPSVLNVVTPAMTNQLRLINGIAVALIAFQAGMELDVGKLRGQWRNLLQHGGILLVLLFAGVFLGALAATPWLPMTAPYGWSVRVAIAVLTASVMTTFSPTVVMAVLGETRASGPLSARVLQLVILADVGAVLIFTAAAGLAHGLDGSGEAGIGLGHVAREIVGSISVGVVAGLALNVYRKLVNRRTDLVLLAFCLLVAEVGPMAGLSPLLCCLTTGIVARAASGEEMGDLQEMLKAVCLPVIVVFFAAAGATLHLELFATVAPIALGLVLLRSGLIASANRVAARVAGVPGEIARQVPHGLISQAGISLGLAVIVGRDFGEWGSALESLFVAVISMHELVGPILFRLALQRRGELPSLAASA